MEGQPTQEASIESRISAALAPVEEPKEAVEAPTEAPEQPTERAEAPEETRAETHEEEVVREDDGEVEEAIEVSSLSDLMEHLGVDPEDAYNITVPVTVNGKRQDVSLSEWKDSYVAAQEAKRHQEEARALREQIDNQKRQAEEQYQAQLAQGAALVESLKKQALERFQDIDWNELRQTDPSEWTAKRMELESAKAQVAQVEQNVRAKIQQYQAEQEQLRSQTFQEHLSKERQALVEAWPEMADESKAATERTALIDELKSRGFTDQEIGNAADHRILLMARDAMRWRQSAKNADVAKKKVIKIGKKVVKPGARQSQAEQRQEGLKPMRDKLRKSGDWKDAAALLSRMRNN